MKTCVCAILVCLLCLPASRAKSSAPAVQVYSRRPGDVKDNTLVCHVTGFYPPDIRIELTQNKREMPGAQQTDLAFEENWHYHLIKHVPFTPHKEDTYACNVTHMGRSSIYTWEPDM
ncbi:beta-2-microglobulin-like [Pseudoliparis swirei]|uniref:beta-2-microglobulin-like n=1 Tax=Pseudoliparis swirei TaxID=2059687 RepID=UPI0024BEC497|nr:beta-2-microglobulin-like [Pseudoliparis swirei]